MPLSSERLNLSIDTTSGEMHAQVDVPTGVIPISDIVPVLRSLGEQAQALEVSNTLQSGKTISCQKGCGACCRQMIPVSPPEAFVLIDGMHMLPSNQQERIRQNLALTKKHLQNVGLLHPLQDLADSPHQHSDDELESLNRAYYALRLPC
ncbi:MAG: YkgJ family cysteine cluster protein, partial [Nitrospirota bacterium]|nr:YkgJ family cysteine cluster protein [Nitrospirota bacterium]